MNRLALFALATSLLLFAAIFAFAKPTNPPQPPKAAPPQAKASPSPRIQGYVTNWGDCLPSGPKQFTLENHPTWSGVGTIREDGSVFILWTLRATDEPCPGVYHVDAEGNLRGIWGHGHDTKLEENGELTGNVRQDRVYRLEPELPDI